MSRIARAQTYPSRPVRIIVGLRRWRPDRPPARLIGQWLSERLGQPFMVENRPGAGNNIGTEAVVRAPADGYTLLVQPQPPRSTRRSTKAQLTISSVTSRRLRASMHIPLILVVHPSFPAATVPEFIAYAKANPGKINMATPGLATAPDLAGELFKMMTGVDMVMCPIAAAPAALTDLIGGQVQVMFDAVPTSIDTLGPAGCARSR